MIKKADASLGGRSRPQRQLGVGLKQELRQWECMSSCPRECGVREKITAQDRALGNAHSWGGVGAGRGGIQEERGRSPISSIFSSAAPPLLLPHLSGAEEPARVPAQFQESAKLKGKALWLSARARDLVRAGWDSQLPASLIASDCVTPGKPHPL